MYNPPIETIIGEMQMRYEGDILRAVQKIGVNVDRDELIRALQYDRDQYDEGYKDGFKRGVEEFSKRLKEMASQTFWESDSYVGTEQIDRLEKEMKKRWVKQL